jgi:hypothetical protein
VDKENTMKRLAFLMAALIAASGASGRAATAQDPVQSSAHASIPFVDHGGIRDWRADNDRSLWIQARNDQWFYAETFGPCIGLKFANRIGFVTEPSGSFDRFSSIIVDGQKCTIDTLRETAPPERG